MANSDGLLDRFRIQLLTEISVSVELEPEKTGLPFPITIGQRPHLKIHNVETGTKAASVSIDDPIELMNGAVPDALWQILLPYILSNIELLQKYWAGDISLRQYARRQKSFAGMYRLVQEGTEGRWRIAQGDLRRVTINQKGEL